MKLKIDPYFTYLAAFILAGVVLAFVQPTPDAGLPQKLPPVTADTTRAQPARS